MRFATIDQYLWDLAARVPAPGGGATAGLHLAQAAALIGMAARYSDTDGRDPEHRDAVVAVRNRADELRLLGIRLGDEPARDGRGPVRVLRAAGEVVDLAEVLAPLADPDVVVDVGAAADAARAAAGTARLHVENAPAPVDDPLLRLELGEALAGVDDVLRRADKLVADVRERIRR